MADTNTKGTLLKVYETSAYNTVGQVENIDFNRSRDTIETTSHDSSTLDREYIAGLQNATVSAEVSWDPADTQQTTLETNFSAGTLTQFQIVFPDSGTTTYQFSGILTSFSTPAPVDGKMMASIEIQVSGAIEKNPV